MLLLQLAFAFGGSLQPVASIGPTTLPKLVRYADLIVIGVVEGTCRLDVPLDSPFRPAADSSIRLGEFRVERWLKGSEQPEALVFVNQAMDLCDVAGMELGTRAMLFLSLNPTFQSKDEALVGHSERYADRPLFTLCQLGSGQMKLHTLDGEERAETWNVRLPRGAPAHSRVEGVTNGVTVSLAWMLDTIAHIQVEQAAPLVRIEARAGETPGWPWQLTLDGDRTATLVVHEPSGDAKHELIVDPYTAFRVDNVLETTKWFEDATEIGAPDSNSWSRRITVWIDGTERTLDFAALGESTDLQAQTTRLWNALRGSFDIPECIDHRKTRRQALEGR